jgi:hypothetical protein
MNRGKTILLMELENNRLGVVTATKDTEKLPTTIRTVDKTQLSATEIKEFILSE